jgi:hypothetical protein
MIKGLKRNVLNRRQSFEQRNSSKWKSIAKGFSIRLRSTASMEAARRRSMGVLDSLRGDKWFVKANKDYEELSREDSDE